ncbi:MAG: hypothetical protein QOE14_42 [Humisphaera sp.]|nr:hypothetical protein [Humisphaera sp.]
MKIPRFDPSVLGEKLRREIAEYEARRIEFRALLKRRQPSRGAKLDDPVLGALKWDGSEWLGRATVPSFGNIPLTLEGGKTVSDKQRHAFERFRKSAEKLHGAVERANFKYYRRVFPEYVQAFGAKWVPDVKTPVALWKELGQPSLHIPRQSGKAWRVEINWPCTWDEEHGHAAYISDGKVARIGLQGEG